LEGLRRQIAPVPPEQFVRFLIRHQHLQLTTKLRGQAGLLDVIEQMEGFEAPAGHWERYLLPARLESYNGGWLDNLTFLGHVVWGRLNPKSEARNAKPTQNPTTEFRNGDVAPQAISEMAPSDIGFVSNFGFAAPNLGRGRPMKFMTRSTPITLMHRDHAAWLMPAGAENVDMTADMDLGGNARAAYECFLRHGALFPHQLSSLLQLVPSQVDDILGELAAAGLVTSDGYPALRALLGVVLFNLDQPANGRKRSYGGRRWVRGHGRSGQGRILNATDSPSGRWTLLRSTLTPAVGTDERSEHWCRLLLRRYGVMFRDLLANESAAPPWQALVRTYRRMEARGEIRGGRFISGVAGEQFALPEVIPLLRSSTAETEEKPLILPATDPLNFTGRIGSGPRMPALPGHWISIIQGEFGDGEPPAKGRHATPSLNPTS
jgi:ATP-dependent Lhr-like helicase